MARIEHFALFAVDAAALKDFYVNVMGLKIVQDNGALSPPGFFLADDDGMALEIIGRSADETTPKTRFVCHIAFTVPDVSAAQAKLETHGLVFETETVVDKPEMKTMFTYDPEGNRLQIVWRAKPLSN